MSRRDSHPLQTRLARLRQSLPAADVPAVLITNEYNRRYLSGFTGSAGMLLLFADVAYLLTDFRYMEQAPQQAPFMTVVEHRPQALETVRELLHKHGADKLGFEAQTMTFGQYLQATKIVDNVEWRPLANLVEQLRIVKDESEIAVVRRAAALADRAYAHIVERLRPGMSEREVALELEFFMRANGATSSSFEIIVASGERSALPHGVASGRVLRNGEFVKLDFGAYLDGYCSDLTRTVMLGQPTAQHRELYDLVARAQMNALHGIRPGMTGQEADALARSVIDDADYGARFGHGTGHGFGMQIHEEPRLNKSAQTVLEAGMLVTVEPGVYLPGFGGVRIEDDILITADGIEVLTASPKSLLIID
jgi:Xaa-Pro aminopeptidase